MSFWIFLPLLIGCCAYAMLLGGAPERVAAGLQVAAFTTDDLVHRLIDGRGYASPAFGSIAIDALLLASLIVLAWRATRFWPLWVAGWQAAAIAGHASRLAEPGMVPAGYAFQTQIWAYPMLLAMAFGTWRHRSRCVKTNADVPWKPHMI